MPPEQVSPSTIILLPPEKLVIEVKTTGGYLSLGWSVNGDRLTTNIVHFGEIYFAENTSEADLGLYQLIYTPLTGQLVRSDESVQFAVIRPGIAVLSIIEHSIENELSPQSMPMPLL